MKAVVLRGHGDPNALDLESFADPVLGQGDSLVRLAACAVNRSDLRIRAGDHWRPIGLPRILGSEMAGWVEGGSSGIPPGTAVAVLPWISCRRCDPCQGGIPEACLNGTVLGWERDGGYAELVSVPSDNLVPLPDGLSPAEAAAVTLSATTAWHMVVTIGRIQPGETVLVLAAGSGLGCYAVQVAQLAGARVIATAGSDEKLARAESLGAEAVDHRDPEFGRRVRRLTNGRGVDLVIEHVGPTTWTQSAGALAAGGRLVVSGGTTGGRVDIDLLRLYGRQISIQGALRGRIGELSAVLRLAASGKIRPIVDRRLPLDSAADAHRALESRSVFGKVLLDIAR